MDKRLAFIAVFCVFAGFTHLATLFALPIVYMKGAMARMQSWGVAYHAFSVPHRVTPANRDIVRPSSDLSYSICLFDLADGPVLVEGTPWDDYASLSVFDANSNNVFVTSLDSREDKPRGVFIKRKGSGDLPNNVARPWPVLELARPKGIVLLRRLATSGAKFAKAASLNQTDICKTIE